MKPGRELDALVAKKVMGECISKEDMHHGPSYFDPLPYSTSIAAAWQVVEKLTHCKDDEFNNIEFRMGHECSQPDHGLEWYVFFGKGPDVWGDTAPHAIALASLKAVGYDP